ARQVAAGVALVGLAVAVVVEAVAGLGARLLVLQAGDGAALAGGVARGAHAQVAGVAVDVAAGVALVDHAVAVVVVVVAGLGARLDVLVTGDGAVGARGGARAAHALEAGVAGLVATGVVVVDLAVAVVVLVVAGLGARLDVLVTGDG